MLPTEAWFAESVPPVNQLGPASGSPAPRPTAAKFHLITLDEFHRRFGTLDTTRAVHSFTRPGDTHVVLTLLAHARPRRIVEIGTALGHMTANLTEWSPDEAVVITLGTVADLPTPTTQPQRYETPDRAAFGCFANHFGKASKALFVTADSLTYDFSRLAPIDFAFIDGAHDLQHVLSDTLQVYRHLSPGGCMVWHDFASTVPWVEVRKALEQTDFPEPIVHVAGTEVAFLHKAPAPAGVSGDSTLNGERGTRNVPKEALSSSRSTLPAARPVPKGLGIVWEGTQSELQSLALVNRELCLRLIARGHDLSLIPLTMPPELRVPQLPLPRPLAERFRRPLARPADVHVRHQWPPDFTPPPAGLWVLIQPWEFGSLPRSWIEPLTQGVDEIWAYSQYMRDCYVHSGVPANRVHVVPLGIDPERLRPGAKPLPLQTPKGFKFLFVGGTIPRKGIDVLLRAYAEAFTDRDDVCLVIKDMGVGTFYGGQTAEGAIARLQASPGSPAIEYVAGSLRDDELAGLYTACDCLVHPYRGEGFGLPILEAMASGLPAIVTGQGAARDFCDETTTYLLPAQPTRFPEQRVGELETVDYPWLYEPDPEALRSLLRRVVENQPEARAKGEAARQRVVSRFTWEHAADAVERRLEALQGQRPRRFRLGPAPTAVLPAPGRTVRPRLSLCLIVRNEEVNLPACLGSAADLVDEVVVVDTGSTDATRDVARRFGAKVVDFPWCDSFAAARNESLRHASGDWIFWLDADDRLDEDNRTKLRRLFAGLQGENVAYAMKCLCLPDARTGAATVVDHVRLFRNHPALRWQYRVHEQILPAIRRMGGEVRWTDVVVHHAGYQDPALRGRKLERDLRLLHLENDERPDDPFTLFNLGSVYQELGRCAEALPLLRRSLERSHPKDSIVRKLYALIASCHRGLDQPQEALSACRDGRIHYPDDAELLFAEGVLRLGQDDLAGAEACLTRALAGHEGDHFARVDAGLKGYKTRHNLAVVYHRQGRHAEAEAQWWAVVGERPDFLPGWLGVAEACLGRQDWSGLEEAAQRLEGLPQGALEAGVLRGRGLLARQELAAAIALLRALAASHPGAVGPRIILSHALLQEGKDPAAAEQALRDVLALEPGNKEATHNLAVLLGQQRHGADALFAGGGGLAALYELACREPSDIHEHLPTLYALAKECQHVTELGTRGAVSTTALLYAHPKKLVCYDRVKYPPVDRLAALAGETEFVFHQDDVLWVTIEETDLLFIDTWHIYEQLAEELRLHAGAARKYVVLHDTTTFGEQGEAAGHRGLWPAVEEFLAQGTFRLKERFTNNNGLTVLERIAQPPVGQEAAERKATAEPGG